MIKNVYLRDMDTDVWIRVKVAAIKTGKTMAVWLIEAALDKLRKEE